MPDESYDDYVEMARSLLGGYESTSELWEANEYVNLALILRSDSVEAWTLKSQILSALDDDLAALAAVEMAIRRAPRCTEAHYVRATVLADLERYDEALQAVERALRSLGAADEWLLEDLYYERATVLDLLERPNEALAALEAGLARCPDSALLRSGLQPLQRERVRRSFKVIDGGRG